MQIVMFGGTSGSTALGDLSKYDGNAWSSLTPSGTAPPAMADITLVNTADGVVHLLGSDGYLYKLTIPTTDHPAYTLAWTQSAAAAPLSPRSGYGAAKDNAGAMWVFGGLSGTTSLNDVWKYDPGSDVWTQITAGGTDTSNTSYPSPRYGHSMSPDASGNLIVFGGNSAGTAMNDLWKFTVSTNTWTKLSAINPPPGRYYHKTLIVGSVLHLFGTMTGVGDTSPNGTVAFWRYYLP